MVVVFPRAVRTKNAEALSLFDGQIDPLHRLNGRPAGVGLPQLGTLDCTGHEEDYCLGVRRKQAGVVRRGQLCPEGARFSQPGASPWGTVPKYKRDRPNGPRVLPSDPDAGHTNRLPAKTVGPKKARRWRMIPQGEPLG